MPLRQPVWRASAALFVIALLSPALRAEAAAVRLRWRSSGSPAVAGYHVYVRSLDGTYGEPRDAGLPPVLPDGTQSVMVGGLNPRTAYGFALSAYVAGGGESGLSNELTMTARRLRCRTDVDCIDSDACTDNERCEGGRCVSDPHVCATGSGCVDAMCDAVAGCLTHAMAEGAACTQGDPCVSGTCAAGTCVIPPEASVVTTEHDLVPSRFVMHRLRRSQMLAAVGSFVAGSFDPVDTGAIVQVIRADGAVLFQADIPSHAMSGRRKSFRYRPRGSSAIAGLRRLVLRWDGAQVEAHLKALLPSAAAAADVRLTWALHIAGLCVRASDLVCRVDGPRLASCE